MYTLQYNGKTQGSCTLDQIKSDLAAGLIPADALYLDEADNSWKPVSGLIPAPQSSPPPAARPLPIIGIVIILLLGAFMIIAPLGLMKSADEHDVDPALRWLPESWVQDSLAVRIFPLILEMVSGGLLAIGAIMAATRNPRGPSLIRATSKYMLLIVAVAAIIPLIGYFGAPVYSLSGILGDTTGKCLVRIIPFALGLYLFRKKTYG